MRLALLFRSSHFPSPWRPGGLALTRRGLDLCSFAPGARLVDMGCGQGETVRFLHGLGYDALGVDLEQPATRDFPFLAGNVSCPGLPMQSLDGIISECVLCLVENRLRTLRAWNDLARPAAMLVLTDIYAPGELPERNAQLCSSGWKLLHFEDHGRELALFSAQMAWYGVKQDCKAWNIKGASYGLWIAQKESS